jgi:hypothetical protein
MRRRQCQQYVPTKYTHFADSKLIPARFLIVGRFHFDGKSAKSAPNNG